MDWIPVSETDQLPDVVFGEVESVSPASMSDLAGAIAAVLDGSGPLTPTLGGFSDPMKTLGEQGISGLLTKAPIDETREDLWVLFGQPETGMFGDMLIHRDTHLTDTPRTHNVGLGLPVHSVVDDAETAEAVISLAADLFVAIDGFYGKLDTGAMRRRIMAIHSMAADEGRRWIPPWDDQMFTIWDRWLEDVWWINLFGPAYVERWGRMAIDRLGVRQVDLPNGGVMIWSAERPPDPSESDTITGYAHKQSFYETLGVDTFIHESLEVPSPGERVPTLLEHQRASASSPSS